MRWVKCRHREAPKDRKFLFYYHCGMGLGAWSQGYTTSNGNSERTHHCYFLVLYPCDESENDTPFQWSETYMVEMDVSWRELPSPPK